MAVMVVLEEAVVVGAGNGSDGFGDNAESKSGGRRSKSSREENVLVGRAPVKNASTITTSPGPGRILSGRSAALAWCCGPA